MTTDTRLWTADRFMADGPESAELVEGRIELMAPARRRHGRTQTKLARRFDEFFPPTVALTYTELAVRTRQNPDTVRIPDVAVLSLARWPDEADDFYVTVCPEVVVEIVSPDNTRAELRRKTAEYLAAGAEQVWIVDRYRRSITIHRADGDTSYGDGDTVEGTGILAGFTLLVADLFAP